MRRQRDERDEAHALLREWGSSYEAMREGGEGAESTAEHYGTRIDQGGHSDPTLRLAERREEWLRLDSVVSALPAHWREHLYSQYVLGLSDTDASRREGMDYRAWRTERDAAQMMFMGGYRERVRLLRNTTSSADREAMTPQVAETR